MRRSVKHSQPRVAGGREPLPACVLKEIDHEIRTLALRYSVSKSWVVATLLADALNIKAQPSFKTVTSRLSLVASRKRG